MTFTNDRAELARRFRIENEGERSFFMRTFIFLLISLLFLGVPAYAADTFEAIDANKDGKIDKQEFIDYVKAKAPEKIGQLDADKNGSLSRKELGGGPDFKKMDTNKDGKVSRQEAADYLVNTVAPAEFNAADTNGDGVLDKMEFETAQNSQATPKNINQTGK